MLENEAHLYSLTDWSIKAIDCSTFSFFNRQYILEQLTLAWTFHKDHY